MSAAAKALTVLMLILSAAYAAVSAALFAKRQDFRKKWQDVVVAKDKLEDELGKKIAAVESQNRKIESEKKEAVQVGRQLDVQLKRAQSTNKRLEGQLADRDKQLAQVQEMNKQLVDQLTQEKKETARLRKKADGLSSNLEQARATIRERDKTIEDQKSAKAETDRTLNETKVALKDTSKQLDQSETILKDLAARNVEIVRGVGPRVDGQVLDVRGQIVVINRGKDNGVMIGSDFSIYSPERGYVGKMRIKEVRKDLAYGSPISELTVKPIQVGDNVTNRIQ